MASISSSDLWVEIWKRLPPKSICRFRCVCRLWNSLLTSTFFIGLHHKFTVSNTPADQKSYLLIPVEDSDVQLQQCVVYQPQQQQRDGGERERVTFLNLPYSTSPYASDFQCICFSICGVVHGVVCLTSPLNIVLWNPTIRKHIYLWYDRTDIPSSVGIGFDAAKNDLKVVVVPRWGALYQVYSVEEDCWRTGTFGDSSIMCRPTGHGCFVNGTIYWLVPNSSMLLLFDCELEEFKTMALPQEVADKNWPTWDIRALCKHGDMLSVVVQGKRYEVVFWPWCIVMWVMEEDKHPAATWRCVVTFRECFGQAASGHLDYVLDPKYRIKFSSNDIPLRLSDFDNQPICSQVFEKTLFLMNAKSYPSLPKLQPLDCEECSSFMCKHGVPRNTVFQSRLL